MPDQRIQTLREKHADFHTSLKGLTGKALLEKKGPLVGQIRKMADAIHAEKREFSAEETQTWETLNEHYDVLNTQIEEVSNPLHPANYLARANALDADLRRPAAGPIPGLQDYTPPRGSDGGQTLTTEQQRSLALSAWCKSQVGQFLTEQEIDACRAQRVNPASNALEIPLLRTEDQQRLARVCQANASKHIRTELDKIDFRADLSGQTGATGAFLIPPATLVRSLEINMLFFGGMRQVAETITTATGERMVWPTADDTSNTGAQLGENTSIGSSVDPAFATVNWDAYKFSSKPVLVPYELLQDSAFDLAGSIGQMLGERIGRITNTRFTTGTGASQPRGIVTAAGSVSAASATAISFDDLIDLIHGVDPAYRVQGCRFMLHDTILKAIRKLKDGDSAYLWQPSTQLGVPDMILGYPHTNNNDMASTMASGTKTVIFGLLSMYKIRRVGVLRLYRLEERYRDTDQDGFIGLVREDGNLLSAGTAPVKVLTH